MVQRILKIKKNVLRAIFLILVVGGVFFCYGILSYHYKIPPYNFIISSYNFFKPSPSKAEPYTQDISKLIEIENEDDVFKKRNKLIKYIWKQEGFPALKIPEVTKAISDERYSDLKNLKQINELMVNMDYEIYSKMYHFQSLNHNNKLVIYHQGHSGDFFNGYDAIQVFLNNGYDVIAISMPLFGMNNQPDIELKRFGKMKFTSHEHFKFLDNENFSSIKFFIEPVIVGVNYAQKINYEETYMVGISGGGWTTVLSAAIDDRITRSYPIAGSYPIYIRFQNNRNWGDYEQTEPNMCRIATYLELYIMSSYGVNRKQTQILNLYDPCCFAGDEDLSYKDIIDQKIKTIGKGAFEIFIDESNYHEISENSLKFILDDLKQ